MVTDNISIVYIQDLIMLAAYQNQCIGTQLLDIVMNEFQHIRQIVLLTDNEQLHKKFYEKSGFIDVSSNNCIGFIKLNTL